MAAIGMVVLLLAMGLMLVSGLADGLARQLPAVKLTRDSAVGFSDALSLQSQALRMSWSEIGKGEETCQSINRPEGIGCLQHLTDGRYLLGVQLSGSVVAPVLWRWVIVRDNRLESEPSGWIDLCPAAALRCVLL